jgi:hypothetical protein
LDFYLCNGTVRQLFAHIQTCLKLEAQRLLKTEADYRPGCETENLTNKFSLGFRKSITDSGTAFLNKMNQLSPANQTQPKKTSQFNPEILFVLFSR